MNPVLATKIALGSIIVITLGFFVFNNSKLFFDGPQIEISSPENGSSFEEPVIEIRGQARNISFISLDDRPILIDEEGNFREKLLLNPGISIIKMYARDKFERETETILQYTYLGTSTPLSDIQIDPVVEDVEEGQDSTTTEETINEQD